MDKAVIEMRLAAGRQKRVVYENAYLQHKASPGPDTASALAAAANDYIAHQDGIIAAVLYPSRGLTVVK